jgi:hypothetical protein
MWALPAFLLHSDMLPKMFLVTLISPIPNQMPYRIQPYSFNICCQTRGFTYFLQCLASYHSPNSMLS